MLALAAWPSVAAEEAASFLVGRLLVATPALKDSFFDRTVIYLVEHNEDGAFGLIVNRTLGDVGVKPLFERLGLDTSDAEGRVRAHAARSSPARPSSCIVMRETTRRVRRSSRASP
jgi:putative AlgH/UPF0301 family transcriptional regulator